MEQAFGGLKLGVAATGYREEDKSSGSSKGGSKFTTTELLPNKVQKSPLNST